MTDPSLTHLDRSGRARMVDVAAKPESERWATARALVQLSPETVRAVRAGDLQKGDLRASAELAGVMAAKRTSELIPLCHPIALSHIEVQVELDDALPGVRVTATARAFARTGVEMEAMTAATVAALTVYDMVKSLERGARIVDVRLLEKHGGKSGDFVLAE